jgi:hypothetical protein
MKRIGLVCILALFGIATVVWFVPRTAPALDRTTVSQIDIQELMRNAHDLPDTTVPEPF